MFLEQRRPQPHITYSERARLLSTVGGAYLGYSISTTKKCLGGNLLTPSVLFQIRDITLSKAKSLEGLNHIFFASMDRDPNLPHLFESSHEFGHQSTSDAPFLILGQDCKSVDDHLSTVVACEYNTNHLVIFFSHQKQIGILLQFNLM